MPKTHISRWFRTVLAAGMFAYPTLCAAQPVQQGGAQLLAENIERFLTEHLLVAMGGIVLLFIFYYSVRLILESQDEAVITKTRKAFIFALVGFAVIAAAPVIRDTFSLNPSDPFNPNAFVPELDRVITFIITVGQGIFVLLVVLHALRMITSQGDEGGVEQARKGIIQNIVGVVVMMLSEVVVRAIQDRDMQNLAEDLAGVASFIVALIAGFSVLALIVASILLIVSTDDALKDRAKKIVTSTIIAVVLAISSYAILDAFK